MSWHAWRLNEAGVCRAQVVGAGCDIPVRHRKQQERCPDTRTLTDTQWEQWEAAPFMSKNEVICKYPKDAAQKKLVSYPTEPGCWHVDWSQRCGAHSCVAEDSSTTTATTSTGHDHSKLPLRIDLREEDSDELALKKEQEAHGDIFRVKTVDEYSRSAEKMKEFLLQLSAGSSSLSSDGSSSSSSSSSSMPPFRHLLKLDDDNLIDLARIACGLSVAVDDESNDHSGLRKACAAAGLGLDRQATKLIELPRQVPRRQFWWSSFRQHDIHSDPEGGVQRTYMMLNA